MTKVQTAKDTEPAADDRRELTHVATSAFTFSVKRRWCSSGVTTLIPMSSISAILKGHGSRAVNVECFGGSPSLLPGGSSAARTGHILDQFRPGTWLTYRRERALGQVFPPTLHALVSRSEYYSSLPQAGVERAARSDRREAFSFKRSTSLRALRDANFPTIYSLAGSGDTAGRSCSTLIASRRRNVLQFVRQSGGGESGSVRKMR